MTIISTHRIHTYKASASYKRRDLSPKKVLTQNNTLYKKRNEKNNKMIQIAEPTPTQILEAILGTIANYMPTIHFTTPDNSVVDDDFTVEELDDDAEEEAWAQYEYAEYLADF